MAAWRTGIVSKRIAWLNSAPDILTADRRRAERPSHLLSERDARNFNSQMAIAE